MSPNLGCDLSTTTDESESDDTSPRPVNSPMGQTEDTPLIVVDKKRKLEVYVSDPDYQRLPGSEVLKLSTQYFRRLREREKGSSDTMKCLRGCV